MNIAIIGYGKIGHEIEKVARRKGFTVKSVIDGTEKSATHKEISEKSMEGVDVCIDFTKPDAALDNIKKFQTSKKIL